jgi:hypothetical protein
MTGQSDLCPVLRISIGRFPFIGIDGCQGVQRCSNLWVKRLATMLLEGEEDEDESGSFNFIPSG